MSITWDIEWNACTIHRSVGSDPANPLPIETIARRKFGDDCIQPMRPGGCPRFGYENGKPTLRIPRRRAPERRAFDIAHEVAEWAIDDMHLEHTELVADQLAAALLIPRQAFMAIYREVGLDVAEIARTFGVTETLVGLRFGEVTWTPIAMFSPERLRHRGTDFGWPDEATLRRMLRAEQSIPELRRIEMTDERRRTLLVAEAA